MILSRSKSLVLGNKSFNAGQVYYDDYEKLRGEHIFVLFLFLETRQRVVTWRSDKEVEEVVILWILKSNAENDYWSKGAVITVASRCISDFLPYPPPSTLGA